MPYKIGIIGATGKLGTLLLSNIPEEECYVVLTANTENWKETSVPQLIINISNVSATEKVLAYCMENKTGLIEGTSGLSLDYMDRLKMAAVYIPVLRAENFSIGHYIQSKLLNYLVTTLLKNQKYNFSVNERHCIGKKDSPSATAKKLAAMFDEFSNEKSQINAIRGGLPVSDHELQIAFEHEELLISHGVRSRMAAVEGCLKAIKWMKEKKSGYWTMEDVYNQKSKYA